MSQLTPVLAHPKLFMVLLGCKPPTRNVEQHDFFFGIAHTLKELIPDIKAFWPDTASGLHIDGWREINSVDGYEITVQPKAALEQPAAKRLFFINLGGYSTNKLEEQHYIRLTVQDDRLPAIKDAMKTNFYKENSIKGAHAHIDEKYGVDVDDIYRIEDVLSAAQKERYQITISPKTGLADDAIHLGYFKLDKIR